MHTYSRIDFILIWARKTVDRNFDKLLLTILIGVSITLSASFRLLILYGHPELDQLSGGWLREQTALLIGALLGLVKGEGGVKKPTPSGPPQPPASDDRSR